MKDKKVEVIDNAARLRAIHVILKQIASNTENASTADIAKAGAANLQEVIESMFGGK